MQSSLHIICPHCDTTNRVPQAKLADGGRCGQCHQKLFEGHPVALDTARFENHLAKSAVPLLIDFWAEWCGPCRMIAPVLEQIATEQGDALQIAKLDVDANPRVPMQYGVQGIPTLILFKGGQPAKTIVGAMYCMMPIVE